MCSVVRHVVTRYRCPGYNGATVEIGYNTVAQYCGSISCYKKECGITMPLKQSSYTRTGTLASDNLDFLNSNNLTKEQKGAFNQVLLSLAEVLDLIAKGEVTHLTLGTPRSRDSFLVTLNLADGTKQFVGFKDLLEMGPQMQTEIFEV